MDLGDSGLIMCGLKKLQSRKTMLGTARDLPDPAALRFRLPEGAAKIALPAEYRVENHRAGYATVGLG